MPSARGKAIRDRDIELRDSVFQDAAERLWDRNRFHGFTTMPKTMPYICRILDELSKGQPLSTTYIALWCATWDNAFVRLGRMPDLAFAAGFSGQRGVRTFHDRLKRLVELGFVEIAPSGAQAMGLVFLPNPHAVIVSLYRAKVSTDGDPDLKLKAAGLQAATYNAFIERAQEIGATDVASSLRAVREPKRAKKAKPKLRLKPSAPTDERDDEADEPAPPKPAPAKRVVRAKLRPKAARA
jgi:hypothetical protein